MKNAGIYIHVPFCVQKCLYCDFISFSEKEEYFSAYRNTLISEIKVARAKNDKEISSVFIGGGTPTTLPSSYIKEIMKEILKFHLAPNLEITIEANPKTLSPDMLKSLKNSGINRLSIGLQAWQDSLLETLGRAHTQKDFIKNYKDARKAGFNNINIDLMFSLPNQTIDMWRETLENVINLNPEHISLYSLIIEEDTPFFELYKDIDENIDREMYYLARDLLKQNGYLQYEISNFSKPGFHSKHNVLYWERGNYYGFGVNSHSMFDNTRYSNTNDLEKYIKLDKFEPENVMKLSEKEIIEETFILGLRMTSGVNIGKYFETYKNVIEKNISLNLLKIENDKIFLTETGMDLANMVMSDFIL